MCIRDRRNTQPHHKSQISHNQIITPGTVGWFLLTACNPQQHRKQHTGTTAISRANATITRCLVAYFSATLTSMEMSCFVLAVGDPVLGGAFCFFFFFLFIIACGISSGGGARHRCISILASGSGYFFFPSMVFPCYSCQVIIFRNIVFSFPLFSSFVFFRRYVRVISFLFFVFNFYLFLGKCIWVAAVSMLYLCRVQSDGMTNALSTPVYGCNYHAWYVWGTSTATAALAPLISGQAQMLIPHINTRQKQKQNKIFIMCQKYKIRAKFSNCVAKFIYEMVYVYLVQGSAGSSYVFNRRVAQERNVKHPTCSVGHRSPFSVRSVIC